jgi:hypothetical protein
MGQGYQTGLLTVPNRSCPTAIMRLPERLFMASSSARTRTSSYHYTYSPLEVTHLASQSTTYLLRTVVVWYPLYFTTEK